MAIIGGTLGYRLLRRLRPPDVMRRPELDPYSGRSKIKTLLGESVLERFTGKVVADFGCGVGDEVIEIAESGASLAVGIDIQERFLSQGRAKAAARGLQDKALFVPTWSGNADFVISLDAFEHFEKPDRMLGLMRDVVRPGGRLLICFGPTWYHPLGGHLFSIFPWAHLLFTERALIRWRSDFKTDGATRFSEVAGGLNQMTIARFERIVKSSGLQVVSLTPVPIRRLAPVHNRITREFTSAVVRCELVKPRVVEDE